MTTIEIPTVTTPAAHRAADAIVNAFAVALGVRVKQKSEAATAIAKLVDRRVGVRQAADALRAGIQYAERVARLASALGVEAEPPEVRQMRAALTELERE